eukprot:symbB.v1.2.025530.t1/scaffold2483.1/size114807/4
MPAYAPPPLPELKVPPAVPKPPLGALPPPAPPGIPPLPPVPNVDPEDIHLQSMEGANLQSWYTVPPTVAALANLTQARAHLTPMSAPPVQANANELMPRFLPVPQAAQEMPGWAKTAYLPGYAQTQAAGHWVSTLFPTSALPKLGQAWANAMPSLPTFPGAAPAPAASAPAPAPAAGLLQAAKSAAKSGRVRCECK